MKQQVSRVLRYVALGLVVGLLAAARNVGSRHETPTAMLLYRHDRLTSCLRPASTSSYWIR